MKGKTNGELHLAHSSDERKALIARVDLAHTRGAVLYDSGVHGPDQLARLPRSVQDHVARARKADPLGRIVITQTAPIRDESAESRAAFLAQHRGMTLVK